jgi:hypothetical protein
MTPKDCPFCHPDLRRVVAQSPLTLTIRDAFPLTPGHTLIVLRRHFADFFDATPAEMAEVWQALRHAEASLSAGSAGDRRPNGYNWSRGKARARSALSANPGSRAVTSSSRRCVSVLMVISQTVEPPLQENQEIMSSIQSATMRARPLSASP